MGMTVLEPAVKTENEISRPVKRRFFLRMPKYADVPIYVSILVLAVYGLLMIASSSMGLTVGKPMSLALILIKQIVFLAGGYYVMVRLANRFTLSFLKSSNFPTWAIGIIVLLLICLVANIFQIIKKNKGKETFTIQSFLSTIPNFFKSKI